MKTIEDGKEEIYFLSFMGVNPLVAKKVYN